jgi:hypothetical protein
VISKESKARIQNIIEKSEKEGAKILLGKHYLNKD